MATEAPEKKRVATEGLLWLTRQVNCCAEWYLKLIALCVCVLKIEVLISLPKLCVVVWITQLRN